jgi:hypothetical protein
MTHTTLVVFAAAATLWQVMRLIKSQSLTNYCILGLLLGTGILAKANFALFVAILLLTLSCHAEGRKVLFSKKILLSLLITAAFSGIYVFWMVDNQDIVFSATHKFQHEVENYLYKGATSLITAIFWFLTPMWLICLCVFPGVFRPKGNLESGFHRQFINRYLLFLCLALFAVVIIGKVTYVKDRWLQPLLFVAPIFFFARLSPLAITEKRFKLFLRIIGVTALAIYIALAIRVVGASYTENFYRMKVATELALFKIRASGVSYTGSFCRLNYPFNTWAEGMRSLGFTNGLIISNDRFVSGNLHVQFPDSTALIPGYRFEMLVDNSRFSQAAVVWQAAQSPDIPAALKDYVEQTYKVQVTDFPVHYLERPYLFARTETITLAVLFFPLAPAPQSSQAAPQNQ